jgi:methylated-DNA-protein-cysteine methyltransferase-like protein
MSGTLAPMSGWERYYRIVAKIPRGKVTTYGAVAKIAGRPRAAREVGYALAALPGGERRVPWQRVLGKRGRFAVISIANPSRQKKLLAAEGVRFDARGRVSLEEYGWAGR